MNKSGAFQKTFSNHLVWLLGSLLLVASTSASIADDAEKQEPSTELTETTDQRPADIDPPAANPAPVPRAPLRASGKPSVEPVKSLPDDDYYSKRAKSLLTEDAADAAKQVSLYSAYPDHNVVMCEAGCYGRASRIVLFTPRVATKAESSAKLEPTAASLPAQAAAAPGREQAQPVEAAPPAESIPETGEITCVAGCYGQVTAYKSVSQAAVQATAHAEVEAIIREQSRTAARRRPMLQGATGAAANRWMTSSAKADDEALHKQGGQLRPEANPASKTGNDQKTPKDAKEKKRVAKPKSYRMRAKQSGEWFQQLSSDRVSRIR